MTMPARKVRGPERPPLALHDRAMDNLRYIRETMERSAAFTHIPGAGGVGMGLIALGAGAAAGTDTTATQWLAVWLGAAALSIVLASWAMTRKAKATGIPLFSGAGRKFAWNMVPPLAVGVVLTIVFLQAGLTDLLPGAWLMLYGTAVVTGGSYSVAAVPLMGVLFMAAGATALFLPGLGPLLLAVGFGGLHIIFGTIIWRRHGG